MAGIFDGARKVLAGVTSVAEVLEIDRESREVAHNVVQVKSGAGASGCPVAKARIRHGSV